MLIEGRIHGLPPEDTEDYLRLKEDAARTHSRQITYNLERAARSGRWLRDRPGRLPMPWPDYCREVLKEESPGWVDFLIENEGRLKGKGYTEAQSVQGRAEEAKPLAGHGEIGNGREGRVDVVNSTGGNGADYLTARIARDRPDILERMKAGEFKSVRRAAIEAGIVKPPSPLRELLRWWRRATEEDRAAFLREVSE